ncbi:anti-sigma factor [Nonomuraea aurantiaca]|uniref:anti-sigma factor n=1 Tax=Nonomuraea aurantiaca TaxID=2878562 RepID=UPI001CD9A75B|nr:anti-sigma factor [Nonomuraea aurantiaca]MCA2229101.1 anti-sigma factor [Nonomuraea aurantiaca]
MRGTAGGSDPHTLVGAYALDAVDDELERRHFEDHLTGCAECALEVAAFTETAARLGSAAAVEPPPGLKERVFAQVDQVRQVPPTVAAPAQKDRPSWETQRRPARRAGRRPRRLHRWRPLVAAVGVAACLAAVVVFGASALQARDELDQVRRMNQEVAAVLTAPDSRIATASARQGGRGTVIVSRSRGKMVFLAAGLADLPEGEVYQLWQLAPGRIRSAGLLSADAAGRTLPVIAAPGPGVAKLGVTVEPAGGSAQPTTRPLFLVNLPAT